MELRGHWGGSFKTTFAVYFLLNLSDYLPQNRRQFKEAAQTEHYSFFIEFPKWYFSIQHVLKAEYVNEW